MAIKYYLVKEEINLVETIGSTKSTSSIVYVIYPTNVSLSSSVQIYKEIKDYHYLIVSI